MSAPCAKSSTDDSTPVPLGSAALRPCTSKTRRSTRASSFLGLRKAASHWSLLRSFTTAPVFTVQTPEHGREPAGESERGKRSASQTLFIDEGLKRCPSNRGK
jgi:hypothetical protein